MFMSSYVGRVVPLYCTASGKLFLSYQNEDYLNNYFKTVPLKDYTDNTLTDKNKLMENLELISEYGYSIDNGEIEEGLLGYAAPIVDAKGSIIASVSVSGPESRMARKKDEILKE